MNLHKFLLVATAMAYFFAPCARGAEHTLTIGELFSLVDQNNKSLQVSHTGVEEAAQNIAAAKSQWLPDINAQLSISYNGNALITSRNFDDAMWTHVPHLGNSFTLKARQTVYSGGAIPASIKIAELGKEKAIVGTELTRQQQRILVLGQYLDLFKMGNGIKVYESNIALTQQLIEQITLKHQQGMALRNDITRYELQLETLKLGLERLKNQREIVNHQLCNALGLNEHDAVIPNDDVLLTTHDEHDEQWWQQQAAGASPLLKQSELAERVAEQKERLARSDSRPKISLFAANDFNGPITVEIPPLNKNLNVWYAGVNVSYNLSALYKNNKKVKTARIATREAQQQTLVTAQQVNNAVQSAHTLYRQALVEHRTQLKSVELARQNYQVVNDRYLNQLVLITDMIDASNLKLNAELLEVDARINIILAYYKIKYATGTI